MRPCFALALTNRSALPALLCWFLLSSSALAQGIDVVVASNTAQIFVAGREVRFENLGTAHGGLAAAVDDPGLREMLAAVGARFEWQPGTRYVAITRADGTLITFTVGSNVVSVGDSSIVIPFAPFYQANRLYLPLLPLAQALGLATHRFNSGYAFIPQILSARRLIGQRRTILEIRSAAPLTWRTSYAGKAGHATLTLQFPGFSNAAGPKLWLGGRDARVATFVQSGPPGFPITTINIDVRRGVHFASHRLSGGAAVAVILARDANDLRVAAVTGGPSVQLTRPPQTPTAGPAVPPTTVPNQPTATPANPAPQSAQPVPTAQPLPGNQSASPSPAISSQPGESPEPAASSDASQQPSPGASSSAEPLQKISDVFVTDTPDASRVTLVLSGPVTFEWHRLGDPDNRFWVDVQPAELIGPARDLKVKLSMVQSIKVSQHQLFPNHVVRISINPTQALDVRIGPVENSPNQLGIEILSSPPLADAPTSGMGSISVAPRPGPHMVSATRGPTQPNLIVIDPGHGGNDPGSLNPGVGLVESHITLAISQRLKAALERSGWHVVLTREGDYEVGDPGGNDDQELQSRCDVANAAGARLFISVHVNASTSSSPNGVTTYYWKPGDRALAQTIEAAAAQSSGVADAGIHRENFYVIHHTFMPAILVETAYLSNPHDASLLAQQWFMNKMADGIARGINDFTGGAPPP